MNYSLINQVCFYSCMGSIVVGAMLGIASIWIPEMWNSTLLAKGLFTTGILFAASALGAIVTKLLVAH